MSVIDCKNIVTDILKDVRGGRLGILLAKNEENLSYIKQIEKLAHQKLASINYIEYSPKHSLDQVKNAINYLDRDSDGILFVSPDPKHFPALDFISPQKRVEGTDFNDNIERVTCTARACVKIIKSHKTLQGAKVLVIGYGKAVGKPVSYLCLREHASLVTITHKYTPEDLLFDKLIPEYDIIISATGNAHFLKQHQVTPYNDKVFIDAGICSLEGKIVGDIDPELQKTNYVSPVPGGVGPVTSALLIQNVWLAWLGQF